MSKGNLGLSAMRTIQNEKDKEICFRRFAFHFCEKAPIEALEQFFKMDLNHSSGNDYVCTMTIEYEPKGKAEIPSVIGSWDSVK